MDKSDFRVISCTTCKNFQQVKAGKSAQLCSCKLDKNSFDIDKLDLMCNRPCYKEKSSRKN